MYRWYDENAISKIHNRMAHKYHPLFLHCGIRWGIKFTWFTGTRNHRLGASNLVIMDRVVSL